MQTNSIQLQREPCPYSIKAKEFWCHLCQKQFSHLKTEQAIETFCPTCKAVTEEITKENDPRSFPVYNNSNQPNNNDNHYYFFESIRTGPTGNTFVSRINSRNPQPNQNHNHNHSHNQNPNHSHNHNQNHNQNHNNFPSMFSFHNNNDIFNEIENEPFFSFGSHHNHSNNNNQQPSGAAASTNLNNRSNFNSLFGNINQPFGTFFTGFMPMNHSFGFLDEIFRILANDPEHQGAPPASKDAIKQIPVIKINESNVSKYEKENCSICQENYKINEDAAQLKCKHLFHSNCVFPWLNMHKTCPVCRSEVNETK